VKLSNAQRDLLVESLLGLPGLIDVWKEAGDNEPPPDEPSPPEFPELFVTIRRIPCDMKPEDGSFRYHQVPPHDGVTADRVDYFYEPAPPNGFPSLLVVVSWRGPIPASSPLAQPPTEP
jgi:hypothetical protein